jgi:hypothetical protein
MYHYRWHEYGSEAHYVAMNGATNAGLSVKTVESAIVEIRNSASGSNFYVVHPDLLPLVDGMVNSRCQALKLDNRKLTEAINDSKEQVASLTEKVDTFENLGFWPLLWRALCSI